MTLTFYWLIGVCIDFFISLNHLRHKRGVLVLQGALLVLAALKIFLHSFDLQMNENRSSEITEKQDIEVCSSQAFLYLSLISLMTQLQTFTVLKFFNDALDFELWLALCYHYKSVHFAVLCTSIFRAVISFRETFSLSLLALKSSSSSFFCNGKKIPQK